MALRLSENWNTSIAEEMLFFDNDQLHWRIPTKLVKHATAGHRWQLGTQHESCLHSDRDVAMYTERTEYVHSLQERCQYAVRLWTFGWLWLPVLWLTRIVVYQRLQVEVLLKLFYFTATQRRSWQILSCLKICCFHEPIFKLEQFQQHKIGYWRL